jgi:cell division protein FtsW
MLYVARYLSKKQEEEPTFQASLIELWLPVFITLMFILPSNFSTAALIFSMVLMLTFVGKYPLKYLGFIIGAGIAGLLLFVILAKAFPDSHLFSRVDTWASRIENFRTDKPGEDDYQIEKAKIAIASGGIYGLGPGKSVQKHFLPQSSSDFIYAIIVEEWGLIGGLGVLFLYLLLFFRFIVAAHKSNSLFGKLLVVGLGFPMIFQAMVNMAVAVELLPVTGQTLPLISSGGSSIWMTCIALGIIINVTKKEEEIAEEIKDKEKREAALQKLIDKQLEEENEDELNANENFSIQDNAANPMKAVLNK